MLSQSTSRFGTAAAQNETAQTRLLPLLMTNANRNWVAVRCAEMCRRCFDLICLFCLRKCMCFFSLSWLPKSVCVGCLFCFFFLIRFQKKFDFSSLLERTRIRKAHVRTCGGAVHRNFCFFRIAALLFVCGGRATKSFQQLESERKQEKFFVLFLLLVSFFSETLRFQVRRISD